MTDMSRYYLFTIKATVASMAPHRQKNNAVIGILCSSADHTATASKISRPTMTPITLRTSLTLSFLRSSLISSSLNSFMICIGNYITGLYSVNIMLLLSHLATKYDRIGAWGRELYGWLVSFWLQVQAQWIRGGHLSTRLGVVNLCQ